MLLLDLPLYEDEMHVERERAAACSMFINPVVLLVGDPVCEVVQRSLPGIKSERAGGALEFANSMVYAASTLAPMNSNPTIPQAVL